MIRLFLVLLFLVPAAAQAADAIEAPAEIKPFIPEKHFLIQYDRADLNGDGREDILFIAQDPATEPQTSQDGDYFMEGRRVLRILTKQKDGSYVLAADAPKAVMCEACGGVFGDPLQDTDVAAKSFTLYFYGGSGWRWSYTFKFNYSRIDQTWQLVESTETSFHASDPENMETGEYTPKDFGKINISDFDPETYLPEQKQR